MSFGSPGDDGFFLRKNKNNGSIIMINITFPDGSVKQFEKGVTGLDIAKSIAVSLAKDALAVEVNGKEQDLYIPITTDSTLKIITSKTDQGLEIIRHDTAHLFAQSLKELYPDAQITIGPSIENGFYYDFSCKTKLSENDFERLEAKMHEIMKRGDEIKREEWDRDEAIKYFKSIGEHYKAEIISDLPNTEVISLYRQGEFLDLCRGPHATSTSYPKFFKLTKIAGAYWRGDSKNEMLQRVYGTAWATKEQLAQYLFMIEEAEKRDHRKLGRELGLFHMQEEARGMVFWHDKGWTLYRLIEEYIRKKIRDDGYVEVKTPVLVDRKLWEASGHWDKFRQNMFTSVTHDEEVLALKPMNCPCHVQIFNQGIKSYRDLPMRMAEFGACHRYEPSGALHGLMRVRGFVQDDAHIFCEEDQITEETVKFCELLKEIYTDFGFSDIKVKFSDRPEVRAGTDETWDKSEKALMTAAKASGLECILNPGEGAFYGPKLEFVLRDAIGRDWQCGTLQVDFVLPERLNSEYVTAGGGRSIPVMLHRAVIGSFERFIGILIEQFAGKFPLWLAPVQVAVVTITSEADAYAKEIQKALNEAGVRTELDISNEKINYKVREFSLKKTPIIAVVGKKEEENGTVAARFLGSEEQKTMKLSDIIDMVQKENKKYL
jgi:threonyl-tRNA synthetase